MQSGMPLYAACVGVCVGLLAGLWGSGVVVAGTLLVVAVGLLLVGRTRRPALLCALALCAASLGTARAGVFLHAEARQTLPNYVGTGTHVVEGWVSDDPDRRETSVHVVLAVSAVDGLPVRGILLTLVPPDTSISYGDKVVVRGGIEEPEAFETDGGRLFDYAGYLRARGILALMPRAALSLRTPAGLSLTGALFDAKHGFEGSIERLFARPQSGLLEGLLLGEKRGVPQELTDAFIRSGLIHVVVLSGYNISIIATAVFSVLAFLPAAVSSVIGGGTIILFALMAGGGAATVRAVIMALIAILARSLHRSAAALNSLVLAATLMALWNPPSMRYDTGFILSVLATFGLITLSPYVERKLRFLPERLGVRSIAASTIAVQCYVLPALLYFTGVLSLVALPANMLALPVVPAAMLLGFCAALLGNLLGAVAALPFALSADLLLRWMFFVVTSASAVPYGAGIVPAFPAWLVILAYVPLTWIVLRHHARNARPSAARFRDFV